MPLFILLSFSAQSIENNILKHLGTAQSITQDKDGFIWISGLHGLMRYDGSDIIHFVNHSAEWPVPFSWIHQISHVDDNLLISTESHNLWLFNPKSGATNLIDIKIKDVSIYGAQFFNGQYYFHDKKNSYRFDPKSSTSKILTQGLDIIDMQKTSQHLYLATAQGLYQIENDTFRKINDVYIHSLITVESGIVAISKNNIFFIGDDGYTHSIKNDDVYAATKHAEGNNFYTIADDGVIKKFSARELTELPSNYPTVVTQKVKNIFHDTSGILWLISSQGITTLSEKLIKNHPIIFDIKTNANELELYNNELVIGSYGDGLHTFDSSSTLFNDQINSVLTKGAKKTMDLLTVGNDLYIATFDGLWVFNKDINQLKRVDFQNNDKLLLKLVRKEDFLYITTNDHGLYIFDLIRKEIIKHIAPVQGLSSSEIIDVFTVDNQNIWLATAKGIDIYDLGTDHVRQLSVNTSSKFISFVLANNKIFAATMGEGIFVFNLKGELLSRFAIGINFTTMKFINEEIWAPAKRGLYRISPYDNQINLIENTEIYSFSDWVVLLEEHLFIPHHAGILEVPLSPTQNTSQKVFISKTTVSGKSYLSNQAINIKSPNEVITLELASLDYRSGKNKQFKYQINDGLWLPVNGNTLTLTGLASGTYNVEVMATNSLGQWSKFKAFTKINVAFPWYWTPQIRILYLLIIVAITFITFWLLYLRMKSISKIHHLLSNDIKTRGKIALNVSRNLSLAIELINENQPIGETKKLLKQSIDELNENEAIREPNGLYGNSLLIALPFFAEYIHTKYHISLNTQIDIDENLLSYEMQSDVYKIIYEAVTSAILKGLGRNFKITLQEFKEKVWITISDDSHCFANFNNKINFDMAMYYIRQIAAKYNASVNTFNENNTGSQIVISIPLVDTH